MPLLAGTTTLLGTNYYDSGQTLKITANIYDGKALIEAERIGLAQKTLVNKEDKPTFARRSLLPEWSKFLSLPRVSRFFK
jgi:hypothetical protein